MSSTGEVFSLAFNPRRPFAVVTGAHDGRGRCCACLSVRLPGAKRAL